MDASSQLTIHNTAYLKVLEVYVWQAYKLDQPFLDVSTKAFLGRKSYSAIARIQANEEGVLAGIQEAEWFLQKLGLKLLRTKKDGSWLKKNDVVLEFQGKASVILGAERTLLNLLQRMSGVATKTKKLAAKMPKGVRLLATRKTLWGLLDKRAVSLGGGATHRLNLSDAILIKENHIALSSNFKKSLKNAFKKSANVRFLELELESVREVEVFLNLYPSLEKLLREGDGIVVMLDNFTPAQVKRVIQPLRKAGIFVELSGGINERTVHRYHIGGIFAISSGSITTQANNLDMSLQIAHS